jgi:hypothetical protein
MPNDPQTATEPWAEVQAVEREIRMCAYTSAGDPTRKDDIMLFAMWAGRLQRAISHAKP